MAGGYRVLELNLISANDLKKVTLLSRMRVYAVASIFGGDPRLPMHSTSADRHGGCCPAWNSVFHFPIPSGADTRGLALRVLLRTERALGARDVGEVLVPVDDLIAGSDRASRPATYQVRRPRSGRPHGMLYFCYKFIDVPATGANKYGHAHASPEKAAHKVVTEDASPATAYPPPAQTALPYGSAYSPPQAWFPYNAVPQYRYAPPPPVANQHGGGGMGLGLGLGLGLLGGAVGGMMVGEMVGDVVADAAYDTAFSDGFQL